MRIWLDDQVGPEDLLGGNDRESYDAWFYNAESVLKLVQQGLVTFIHFDHDLGVGHMTGYDLAKEIEKLAFEVVIGPIGYGIHSGNPVGAANIDAAMKSACKFWERS